MKISEFDYTLPEELIAQNPIEDRSASRLLVLHRATGSIEHRTFHDIVEYLQPSDVVVANDTRVIPARLFGHRRDTGGKLEVLLLKKQTNNEWIALTKTGGHIAKGTKIIFKYGLEAEVIDTDLGGGQRLLRFYLSQGNEVEDALNEIGVIPLPPYIHEDLKNPERYQTVYSRIKGSVASPTAGLHFTKDLLRDIRARGIDIHYVTLHISLDTFQPIKVEDTSHHKMYSEHAYVTQSVAQALTAAKRNHQRIIAVGTTTTRILETIATEIDERVVFHSFDGWTDLFIEPGYQFKVIDGLVTNFHLPRSSLLLLVSAYAGSENIKYAYQEAIQKNYRFYSFGDAMFIV